MSVNVLAVGDRVVTKLGHEGIVTACKPDHIVVHVRYGAGWRYEPFPYHGQLTRAKKED